MHPWPLVTFFPLMISNLRRPIVSLLLCLALILTYRHQLSSTWKMWSGGFYHFSRGVKLKHLASEKNCSMTTSCLLQRYAIVHMVYVLPHLTIWKFFIPLSIHLHFAIPKYARCPLRLMLLLPHWIQMDEKKRKWWKFWNVAESVLWNSILCYTECELMCLMIFLLFQENLAYCLQIFENCKPGVSCTKESVFYVCLFCFIVLKAWFAFSLDRKNK